MRKIILLSTLFIHLVACSKMSQEKPNTYQLYEFQLNKSIIALSPLPGRVNLNEDIAKIKEANITHVLTLVSNDELTKYKVPTLLSEFENNQITVFQSPIVDYGLPTQEQMKTILSWLQKQVKAKNNILIHCVGGLGRSGTVMAVYAKKYLGKTGEEAIKYVRSIRGEDAVETKEQQDFVINW